MAQTTCLLFLLLLLPCHVVLCTNSTSYFGNETVITNAALLSSRMYGNNRQAIYVRMNLTTINMQEKDIVLDIIAVKSTSLLFVDPYVRFFTLKRITENFIFADVLLSESIVETLVKNITSASDKQVEQTIWQMRLLQHLDQMPIFEQFKLCAPILDDDEFLKKLNLHSLSDVSPFRSMRIENSFVCCNMQGCSVERDSFLFVVVHVTLHTSRIIAAFAFIYWFYSKMRFFTYPEEFRANMTNMYYMAPFYITDKLPVFVSSYSNDVRGWVVLQLVAVHLVLYGLAIVHCMVPHKWPREAEIGAAPLNSWNQFIEYKLWVFGFIIIPILIIVNAATDSSKIFLAKANARARFTSNWSIVIQKVLHILFAILIGVFLAGILGIIIHTTQLIRGFTVLFTTVLMLGVAMVMSILMYQVTPVAWYDVVVEFLMKWARGTKEKSFMLMDYSTDDVVYYMNEPEEPNMIVFSSLLKYYFTTMIPSLLVEAAFLGSTFFVAYVGATVATRFIWSTLLLFIFNPEQVQIYLYVASLCTAFYKFYSDLNEPYAKVMAFLVANRNTMTIEQIENSNRNCLQWTRAQIKDRKRITDECSYFMLLKIEQFKELCHCVGVTYFIRAIIVRMLLTLFVIFMFFLGTSIFSSEKGNESFNLTLKILASSLLPIIPQLVGMLTNKSSDAENAIFNSRVKHTLLLMEAKYGPVDLQSGVVPRFVVLNIKAPPKLSAPPLKVMPKQE